MKQFVAFLVLVASALAQVVPTADAAIQFAHQQSSGTDACGKIQAAWNALPNTGGIVYGTGFAAGNQSCANSPFLAGVHPGTLYLGNTTFQTTTSWVIPQAVIVKGIGGAIATQGGSVIQAAASFPANTPVVQSANDSINQVRLEELTVDCNAQLGATGIKFNDTEEMSGLRHVLVTGCPGVGIDIGDGVAGHSQNAGGFEDLYVVSGSNSIPVAGTIGVRVNLGDSIIRSVHGLTVNYTGAFTTPTNCMVINSSGSYDDLHFEGCTNGINVSAPAHSDVQLSNIDCSSNVTDCVHVTSGSVTIINMRAGGKNVLNDTVTGNVLSTAATGGFIRFYPEERSTWSGYYNGALTTTTNWISAFVPERAISITRVDTAVQTAGVDCAIAPVVTITNGRAAQSVAIANGNNGNSSGGVNVNVAGGTTIRMELTTAAAGCRMKPQNLNITVEYKMQ